MSFTGLLNQWATLVQVTEGQDDYGSFGRQETDGPRFRICVQQESAEEREIKERLGVVVTHKGYIKPRDISTNDRLRVGNKAYNIVGVNDVQARGRVMEIGLLEVD